MDDRASEVHFDRSGHARAGESHHYLRARRSHQQILRLLRRPFHNMERIDLDNSIALANTSRFGRSVRKHLGNDNLILLRLDLHADAAVSTASIGRESLQLLRSQELAVWIVELLHKASRRLLVKLARVESIDVALIDELENLIEQRL